jgi:acetyl esterase/lipase
VLATQCDVLLVDYSLLPEHENTAPIAQVAERVTARGGSVELEVTAGMWHVRPMWGSFPEATAALERAASFSARCR